MAIREEDSKHTYPNYTVIRYKYYKLVQQLLSGKPILPGIMTYASEQVYDFFKRNGITHKIPNISLRTMYFGTHCCLENKVRSWLHDEKDDRELSAWDIHDLQYLLH